MENTYWNGRSQHMALYETLFEALVPPKGLPATDHGRLLLYVNRIYKRFYNDGDRTWGPLLDWTHIPQAYMPPEDAPPSLINFFETLGDDAMCLDEEYAEELLNDAVFYARDKCPDGPRTPRRSQGNHGNAPRSTENRP